MRIRPGSAHPRGAHWDGRGTNFALYSRHATGVSLCLFDDVDDAHASATIPLREETRFVWHASLPDVRPGQLYGYRVEGPWDPSSGHRFNGAKLLVDPYALAITGEPVWSEALRGHVKDPTQGTIAPSTRDSAPFMPRCVVVDRSFDWGSDRAPRTPWSRTVVYECHVKGMTLRHPEVPEALRGTYAGLASEPVIEHLRSLGVTAVELMPVQHRVSEPLLVRRGLANYWGYGTLGFFAPDPRFARGRLGEQVAEFKAMVRDLHRAGLEVLLDVAYSHSGEGGGDGPTLCFRGIDNASYYRLAPDDPPRYVDDTGCQNTLDASSAPMHQLLMDSLRYWVEDMHVDGFRFDLAPALAREGGTLDRLEHFFEGLQQDPALAETKLIAEPWDLGPGGYRLGSFPPGWAEWNDRYRDGVRRYWRGDADQLGELARRVSGSADLFDRPGRDPFASVNFVAAHDGFTLADLFRYERKHNEANGHANRDGSDANWSSNGGFEGPGAPEAIERLRIRSMKNALATLAVSQGIPMLGHGDELGRTQRGNNNAYCQDNEISWVDWSLAAWQRDLLDFCRRVFALRAEHPALRQRRFLAGEPRPGEDWKDVTWLSPAGDEMAADDWRDPERRALGMLLGGARDPEIDREGGVIPDDPLYLVFNAEARAVVFRVPPRARPGAWAVRLATDERPLAGDCGPSLELPPRSFVALVWRRPPEGNPSAPRITPPRG